MKKHIHILTGIAVAALLFLTAVAAPAGPSQERQQQGQPEERADRSSEQHTQPGQSPERPESSERSPGEEGPQEENGDEQAPGTPPQSPEDRNEFVYCITPPAVNLDPLHTFTSTEAQVYTALYEGLVTYNPFTLQPSPGIAERWETSEDDTVYRFFLRSNARYSNGDRITAGHVRETLLTLIDPDEEAEYANLLDVVKNVREYRNGQISDPSEVGIYAEEEDVVRFELEHPANHLLKILCHHSFSPLHPEMLEGGRWDSPQRLISNGPFYIAESSEDEMLLKKNTQYWDADEVALEALRIVYREDEAQITKDFNRGEIHWTEAPVDYDSIASRDALVVNHLFSTSYYFFSAAEEPYNNPAVRRALALLLRWENIRSSEYMYIPTSTLVPQIGAYPELEGITERNEERALSLLSEEGYPGGSGLPEITIAIPEGEESRRIAEEMQEAWEETLDVKVEIEGNPYRSYYDRLKEQPFTIGTLTWIGDFADPLTFLGMWTSDSNLNISKYEQPQFDSLIQEALPQSGQERYETMSEAEKILLTGAVVLPIKHAPAFNIIDLEYIEGWYPNPLDIHPFKYVRFGTPSIPEGVVRDFSYPGRRAVRAPSAGRPLRSPDVLWKPSTTNWSRR